MGHELQIDLIARHGPAAMLEPGFAVPGHLLAHAHAHARDLDQPGLSKVTHTP